MHTTGKLRDSVEYVSKLILYIRPDGNLIVSTGNRQFETTPEETRELLDYLLLFADRFSNGNKKLVPSTESTSLVV